MNEWVMFGTIALLGIGSLTFARLLAMAREASVTHARVAAAERAAIEEARRQQKAAHAAPAGTATAEGVDSDVEPIEVG